MVVSCTKEEMIGVPLSNVLSGEIKILGVLFGLMKCLCKLVITLVKFIYRGFQMKNIWKTVIVRQYSRGLRKSKSGQQFVIVLKAR